MNNDKYHILFVDDEAQTRKMFERLVGVNFNVICAEDVAEAKQILHDKHQNIGVLITDQRMPGELGVELLRYVRTMYPNIIRLLTTAYSDLDDAIGAVNQGEIFRYINKPWHVDELLIDLRLAMNFFELECDRFQLIEEKVNLSKRQYRIEMLRAIIALGGAQVEFSRTDEAMSSLLTQLATVDSGGALPNVSNQFWHDEVKKTQKIANIALYLNESLKKLEKSDLKINSKHNFKACSEVINTDVSTNLLVDGGSDSNTNEVDNDICILLSFCAQVLGRGDLLLSVAGDNQFTIEAKNPSDSLIQQFVHYHSVEADLIGILLAIFIVVKHSNGMTYMQFESDKLKTIKIDFSADKLGDNMLGQNWIEDVFILHSGA